jgi:LmbE family N-acetylglucosaminyl deacetylase
MQWVYLSPHLDDVALSCGGLVWQQVQAGEQVAVWTVCAGDPPAGDVSEFARSLHTRWQTGEQGAALRRVEDLASCAILGASARHLDIPDCIYRRNAIDGRPLYTSEAALFGELDVGDAPLVEKICQELLSLAPTNTHLVCPLALGGHVDHRLTRQAAEKLALPLWYYADYPYVLQAHGPLAGEGNVAHWQEYRFSISEAGQQAWGRAIAAYASQISTFWVDLSAMKAALEEYSRSVGGLLLWFKSQRP